MTDPWVHVVNISGGKDSAALYLLALERMEVKGRRFTPVFADTGNEHEWTYDFVRELAGKTGGPEPRWVKADLSSRVLAKRDVVLDKWVKEGVPTDIIERALAVLTPTGNPFLDLVLWKGRFPSTKARFCTEELKVGPINEQVDRPIVDAGLQVVSWQGVRAEESLARSLLPVWQRLHQNDIPSLAYRPLLRWRLADVWAMHEKHGLARNPLYENGMERVGCMPCIMAKKQEVAEISRRFPEHVERIAEWEYLAGEASKRGATTFFSYDKTPGAHTHDKTIAAPGIRQVVKWAQTDKGGRQYNLETFLEFGTACNQWGACE